MVHHRKNNRDHVSVFWLGRENQQRLLPPCSPCRAKDREQHSRNCASQTPGYLARGGTHPRPAHARGSQRQDSAQRLGIGSFGRRLRRFRPRGHAHAQTPGSSRSVAVCARRRAARGLRGQRPGPGGRKRSARSSSQEPRVSHGLLPRNTLPLLKRAFRPRPWLPPRARPASLR